MVSNVAKLSAASFVKENACTEVVMELTTKRLNQTITEADIKGVEAVIQQSSASAQDHRQATIFRMENSEWTPCTHDVEWKNRDLELRKESN